jgi:hypothetical protein
MSTIDIDFEVYKALTNLRENENTTYNDVLRQLLGLDKVGPILPSTLAESSGCIFKGVFFPNGTQFRANYKGRIYAAKIEDGALVQDGEERNSPSEAAYSITKSAVNGWRFWECKRPQDTRWQLIDTLRSSVK